MNRSALPVAAVIIGALGCGGGQRSAEPMQYAPARLALADSLTRIMPLWLDSLGVPGAAVAIVHDGRLVWEAGFGVADTSGRPVTAATVFQVASLSKPVAAWGVMRLVEQGMVALDDPIGRHLTRWQLPESDSGRYRDSVTIRRLLSHTAGLSTSGYLGTHPDSMLPSLEQSLRGASADPVRLVARPGAGWQYSGGGYTVLQLLVEEVTRRPFAAYMEAEVLRPLGMWSSAYGMTRALAPRVAQPFERRDSLVPAVQFVELAAAGLHATAGDIGRFLAAAMGESKVLSQGTVAEMLAPAPNSVIPQHLGYGLGYLLDTLTTGEKVVLHNGANQGWRATFLMAPSRRSGVVLVANANAATPLIGRVGCAWVRIALESGRRGCRPAPAARAP